MTDSRCHICLDPINQGQLHHPECCRKLFGSIKPPHIPYTWGELNKLAELVIREQVSVPGVQPKLSLHLEPGSTGEPERLTLVGLEGQYILKPPVEKYPEMPELEHVTMLMARQVEIECAPCGLVLLEDGHRAYITRRMDRVDGRKLHLEDMCQLTDRLTEDKYLGSLEQVGKVLWRHCENAGYDVVRFFELTVFCFLTGNSDMHLKNFSLLYTPGGPIRLSPAYDLLPTNILIPKDKEECALTMKGKKRKLTRNDFKAFGASLNLNDRQVENAIQRICSKLEIAKSLISQSFCSPAVRGQYTAAICERLRRLDWGL